MTRRWTTFAMAAGIAGLSLTLVLTGCGKQDTGEQAPAEEAVESEATDGEAAANDDSLDLETPSGLAALGVTVKSLTDVPGALDADPEEIEVVETEEQAVEVEGTIEEGAEDESKDFNVDLDINVWRYVGGMRVALPIKWTFEEDGPGYDIASDNGAVLGYAEGYPKESGYVYDVTRMTAAFPQVLKDTGFKNIQVLGHEHLYSASGKLVDSYIQVKCKKGGKTYMVYCEYLESAKHVNNLILRTLASDWNENFPVIQDIIDSVQFAPGHAI